MMFPTDNFWNWMHQGKEQQKKREWSYQIIEGLLGLSKEYRIPFHVPEER